MINKKKKIKIVPIIIVRLDSKRLPGKCLIQIFKKKNILECIILQLSKIKNLDKPILAIPNDKINNPLEKFALKNDIKFYRGKKNNVAKRVLDCANFVKADYILRINGDSPIVDKDLISSAINNKKFSQFYYHSNIIERTYPYGITLQIIKRNFLKKLLMSNKNKNHLEHITPLFNNKKYFKYYRSYKLKAHLPWKKSVTLDTTTDYKKLKKLFKNINFLKNNFCWLKSITVKKYLLND